MSLTKEILRPILLYELKLGKETQEAAKEYAPYLEGLQ